MQFHSDNAYQLTQLFKNLRSVDKLRLSFDNFDVPGFQLELHPDLKVPRLFVQYNLVYDSDALQPLRVTLQFAEKVESIHHRGFLEQTHFLKMLQSFSTIKVLKVYDVAPKLTVFGTATVNPHLTELLICGEMQFSSLLDIFENFPNLKKLSMLVTWLHTTELTQEGIDRLHVHLNQLERFAVNLNDTKNVHLLSNITDLNLFLSRQPFDYALLREACRNMRFLSIISLEDLRLVLEKVFENFPELTTLQLDSMALYSRVQDILRVINDKAHNLNTLKLEGATKEFLENVHQVARSSGIEGFAITNVEDENEFESNAYSSG